MNTGAQTTDQNVTQPAGDEVSAQSADSSGTPAEQAEPPVSTTSDESPRPHPMIETLFEMWDEMDGPIVAVTTLLHEAWWASSLLEREAKLKQALALLPGAAESIKEGIKLNGQQRAIQVRPKLAEIAKSEGFPSVEAMLEAGGFKMENRQGSQQSDPGHTPATKSEPQPAAEKSRAGRNLYPDAQTVYEYLAYPDHNDYQWGYTQSLRSLTEKKHPWAKKLKNGKPDPAHFRKADENDIAEMQRRREQRIAEVNAMREARAAKKT